MRRVKIEPEKRPTSITTKPKKKRSYVKKGGNGGARPGTGRKRGSTTTTTSMSARVIKTQQQLIEEAHASGDLPQVWLLKVMRADPNMPVYTWKRKKRVRYYPTFEEQLMAAKAAAPYFAAKLSSMAMTGEGGGPVKVLSMDPTQLAGLPPEYLDVLRRVFGSMAGKEKEPLLIEEQGSAKAYEDSLA